MFWVQFLPAQTLVDTLRVNNVAAFFSATDGLFYNKFSERAGLLFPANLYDSTKTTIYKANYWIAGKKESDSATLHLIAPTYGQFGEDTWAGPVATNYNDEYDNRYKRVFKITKTEIDLHIANYNQPGYTLPAALADWPAQGNTANGEAFYLAPFVDVNADGVYTPLLGDYPAIQGDAAIYFIRNDSRETHTESGGEAFGFELHTLAYAYNNPDLPHLHNTIFVNLRLINRSDFVYNALLGMWADFDIGLYANDAAGCDTNLNMIYAYNFQSSDFYYPNSPPAQSCIFLNKLLYAHITSTSGISSGGLTSPLSYFNILNGMLANGLVITNGGNGTTGTEPTRFMFSGNPVTNEGWTSINSFTNPIGDISSIGSAMPFTIHPNESICFDFAFTAAIAPDDTPNAHLASVAILQQYAQQVKNWYDDNIGNCAVNSLYTAVLPATEQHAPINVVAYPNPTNDMLWIKVNCALQQEATILLYDVAGKLLHLQKNNLPSGNTYLNLPFGNLPSGIYQVAVQTNEHRIVQKVVKY